jgi:hypothetical protein
VGVVLEFALGRYDPERLRLYVLDWNKRSKKVAASHGFAVSPSCQATTAPSSSWSARLGTERPQSPRLGLKLLNTTCCRHGSEPVANRYRMVVSVSSGAATGRYYVPQE